MLRQGICIFNPHTKLVGGEDFAPVAWRATIFNTLNPIYIVLNQYTGIRAL